MRVRDQLDGERAHKLVEECLNGLRAFLEQKGLAGATSSRQFILRYLGMHLLDNVQHGQTDFLTTYSDLQQAWATHSASAEGERGIHAGTEHITPKNTFSQWVIALRKADNEPFEIKRSPYKVQLRFHRPGDDPSRDPREEGDAGIKAEFFHGAKPLSVRPAKAALEPKDSIWKTLLPIEQDDQRAEKVDRILARLRATLNDESPRVLDILDADPERLRLNESSKIWNKFKTATKRSVAAAALMIIVSLPTAILTAPPQAQAAVSHGWNELKKGLKASYLRWCIGCDEPNRKTTWDFEKPERYYSPATVELGGKQYAFTITARPSSALPIVASKEPHVEAVAYPDDSLRVRMAISASENLRRDDAKYYINFGDDPQLRGSTNKMIAVGPSALAEHVFPRAGTYVVRIIVAERFAKTREAAPLLPPSESDLYAATDFIKVTLHVGRGTGQ